jgi:uncharacterized protein YbaR (Trm112 family)
VPENPNNKAAPLDPEFLALLCCPACDERPPVRLSEAGDRLLCDRCGRAYTISPEGIPNLLVEEAEMTRPSDGA